MLIRTQDKLNLIELDNIYLSINRYVYNAYNDTRPVNHYLIEDRNRTLGKYSTEVKAKKVLDMIEKKYLEPTYINDLGSGEYAKYEHQIFYMPEDDEVIVNE